MVDANQHVRVCLHPKLVRSKFEFSPLEENHMEEANLLTKWLADKERLPHNRSANRRDAKRGKFSDVRLGNVGLVYGDFYA